MSLLDYNFAMLNAKTYLIGGAILMAGLFGSSLNAANMKGDGLACKTPQDLDAMTRSMIATGACHFIPSGTYVIIERAPFNNSICVRPLGEIDCFWVNHAQVINR
jgi:hypothetical protein